jgi:outer membrane protein OmpA-like peptidoglycan-associated protein
MSKQFRKPYRFFASTVVASALAVACGSSQPTPELVDARRAYDDASRGKANELVPDKLLEAKQALEQAERYHGDEPGSFGEKSLAYIAQRKAMLAVAYAGMAEAQRDFAAADAQYKAAQDQMRKSAMKDAEATRRRLEETKKQLEQVRSDLKSTGSELGEKSKALQDREKALAAQKSELEARQRELEKEKAARLEAEKRAAAAMASLAEIAKIKEESRGMVITLEGSVLFASGKWELLPIARNKLDKVAEVLQDQDDSKKIVVEGHTDSVGSDSKNLELSQKRAEAVRQHLVSQGVKPDRISAVGKGETTPVADNKSPEGRANNRRVEIVVK